MNQSNLALSILKNSTEVTLMVLPPPEQKPCGGCKEPCCLDCGACFNVGEEQFCIKNCLITSLLKNLFQSFLGLMKEYEASRETKYEVEKISRRKEKYLQQKKKSVQSQNHKTNSNDITIKQQAYQDLKTAYSGVNESYKHSLDNYITEVLLE
ncbi:1087_t:CDS:2 [Entrophospora sp. SA101]|nr:1087_t:CDS:2 [Entrophospora sp. SA101]